MVEMFGEGGLDVKEGEVMGRSTFVQMDADTKNLQNIYTAPTNECCGPKDEKCVFKYQ